MDGRHYTGWWIINQIGAGRILPLNLIEKAGVEFKGFKPIGTVLRCPLPRSGRSRWIKWACRNSSRPVGTCTCNPPPLHAPDADKIRDPKPGFQGAGCNFFSAIHNSTRPYFSI